MCVLLGGLQGCILSVMVLSPAPRSYLPISVVLGSFLHTGSPHSPSLSGPPHPGISHVPAELHVLVELDMQKMVPLLLSEVQCDI